MKKFYLAFLILGSAALSVCSCKKQTKELINLPPAEASLIRNLVFTNQVNTEKNVSYGASIVKPAAGTDEGNLYIRLQADSDIPGTASETVILYIKASHLGPSLAKGYTFGTVEPALNRVYYTYSFKESATSVWGSITDSKLGVVFEGLLNITSYDATHKLISGSYLVKAKKLINDPTVKSIGGPVDPFNECDLTLSGNFTNVRIQ